MAEKPSFDTLKSTADEIYELYSTNFAGKPRATRELTLLDELIGRLGTLIDDSRASMNGDRNPAMLSFIETATDNLQRYQNERQAIEQAKRDPHAFTGATLADRANRVFDLYRRHFSGQDRGTRDRMLLHEMVGELEAIQAGMREIVSKGGDGARQDLETVSAQLQMYRDEMTNIARSQTTGTKDDVASRLAGLANAQFKLYTDNFAGKSRVSRRPGLLERMIANLEEYQAEMRELLEDGYTSESNRNNIGIVANNLEMYRSELKLINEARSQTAISDLAGALGGAANDVFALYRDNFAGKDRKTRDLALMGLICDQLREIALQMREIEQNDDVEMNQKNLRIVEERWSTYEVEYRRIEEAKGNA